MRLLRGGLRGGLACLCIILGVVLVALVATKN